ncbi:hypothetical protein J6590_103151, partial [Homalodisca vitripennis]
MHIGGMVSNNPCMHLLISRSPCPILTIGMISDFGYESGTLLPIVRRNSSLLAYHGSPIKLECFNVSSSNMVYIALWIFPDYRRIPWELTTPSNKGGVTQNSGEVVACNRHGDRVGQCAGAKRATFDRISERAQSGRLSVNGFGRERTCGRGASGRVRRPTLQTGRVSVPINYVGLGRLDGGSWGLWGSGNTGSMVR